MRSQLEIIENTFEKLLKLDALFEYLKNQLTDYLKSRKFN